MMELTECRKVYGDRYIRMSAFDSSHGWESQRLSFIVNRPKQEPGFRLERHEVNGRNIRYTTTSYAVDPVPKPARVSPCWSRVFAAAISAGLKNSLYWSA